MNDKPTVELSRGIADITLSPEGKKQAAELGRAFGNRGGLEVVYCGPLWRTRQTAQAICDASPGCRVVVVPALRTWSYGGAEGQSAKDTKSLLMKYAKKLPNVPPPGRGAVSGAEGDAFNDWKRMILLRGFQPILRTQAKKKRRVGVVTSSRDIYTFNGWLDLCMPKDLNISFKPMEGHPQEPAEVERVFQNPGGTWDHKAEKMEPNGPTLPDDIFLIRHASTAWNG